MNSYSVLRRFGAVFIALSAGIGDGQEPGSANAPTADWQAPRRRVRRVYSQSVQWHDPSAETLPAPQQTPDERIFSPPEDSGSLNPLSLAYAPPQTARPARPPDSHESAQTNLWLLAPMDFLLGTTNDVSHLTGFGWLADKVAARAAEMEARENERRQEDGTEEESLAQPFSVPWEGAINQPPHLRRFARGTAARPGSNAEARPFQPERIFFHEPEPGNRPEWRLDRSVSSPDGTARGDADFRSRREIPFAEADRTANAERRVPSWEGSGRAEGPPSVVPQPGWFSPGAWSPGAPETRPIRSAIPAVPSPIGRGADAHGRSGTLFSPTSEFRPAERTGLTPLIPGAVPDALPDALDRRPTEAAQPLRPLGSPFSLDPPGSISGARPGAVSPPSPGSPVPPMRRPE